MPGTKSSAVLEHGYTQREVADHLRIHFTSVSRILRARDKMLIKYGLLPKTTVCPSTGSGRTVIC